MYMSALYAYHRQLHCLKSMEFFSRSSILSFQVYRHEFSKFRKDHPGTRIGEPPPYGLPGFNSGVLLLDLNLMRKSSVYNSLLDEAAINGLSNELHFKGHLGDQDFYTLIGMHYEQLFYVLPCQWNRQLCRWWAENGYQEVFELYHRCEGDIMIYHGNCNTPIPWVAFTVTYSFAVSYFFSLYSMLLVFFSVQWRSKKGAAVRPHRAALAGGRQTSENCEKKLTWQFRYQCSCWHY